MAESSDRGDRETPTVVTASSYEGVVRATLLRFGSPNPDMDMQQTKDYWRHCQSVRIAPEVCGALIYETVRHRHDQTVMLKENVGLIAAEPTPEAAAPTDRGQEWEVRVHRHRGYSLAKMKEAAGRKPDEITDRNIIWGEFYDDERAKDFARKLAQGGFIAVYGPRNELYRSGANESDWLTDLVRSKQDSTLGLAFVPDVVRAMMSPPYSLSKARAWKLLEVYTQEGELEMRPEGGLGRLSKADIALCPPGPQGTVLSQMRVLAAGASSSREKAEDRVGFKWIDVSFAKIEDAEKFLKLIEKQASNIGAFMGGTSHGAIVTTNANHATIQKVLKKHRWAGGYSIPAELKKAAEECAGDPSAMETIEAVAEPVTSSSVPWVKVTRDVDRYSAAVRTADKIGPIKDARAVYTLLGDALNKEDQEVFCVVLLDLRGNLRGVCEVARGQRSRVTVGVADVLRPVIASGAEGYIVVHNHPSGKASPSKADRDLTRLIAEATKPYGKDVCFIDHVVIGLNCAYSICESKLYKC